MRLLTVSPRSGRQKKLQIRDDRAVAAACCAGLAANVPTSPGLRRLALRYTLSPATGFHQLRSWLDKRKFVGHAPHSKPL